MRIRFLHSFMYPDKSAVSQLMSSVAFHLASQGHDVEVVASQGRYEGGGHRLPKRQRTRGVSFYRTWSPNLGKGSILARLLDLCSYSLGSALHVMLSPHADRTVILTNPPMYAAVGIFFKLFRREPYVYVLMDIYPDIAVRAGLLKENGLLTRLARWATKATFRYAERIVTLGRCMEEMVELYGIAPQKIAIIPNWSDGETVRPLPPHENPLRKALGFKDEFVVMYSGNMGVGHRFDDILQVALNVRARKDIRFLFVGNGVRKNEILKFQDSYNLKNIMVRDYYPLDALGESLPVGDVHFVSLREGFEGLIVPSKAYGIMAAGRPMIYQGNPRGEIARMLLEQGGGQIAGEGDVKGIQEIITGWADNRTEAAAEGTRARKIFEENYTEHIGLRLYQGVLEGQEI